MFRFPDFGQIAVIDFTSHCRKFLRLFRHSNRYFIRLCELPSALADGKQSQHIIGFSQI
jgi:hypothetical protein